MTALKSIFGSTRYYLQFANKRVVLLFGAICFIGLLCIGIGITALVNRSVLPPILGEHLLSNNKTSSTDSTHQTAGNSGSQSSNKNTQTAQSQKNGTTQSGSASGNSSNVPAGQPSVPAPSVPPSTPPPSPPAPGYTTYFGASVANPGGSSSAAAQTVITKWGTGSAVRQFFGSDITIGPYHPSGATVVHSSYKPDVASVNSGALDAQITALIQRTPPGDIIEFYHEPDNDGLDATGIANMIAAKNRLYDLKQQVKPSVKVAATMTGGFFANYTAESKRSPWYGLRGDLVGLDADGVHDTTGPTYDISYSDEIAGVKTFMGRNTSWKGWTVPEHGTSRQPWDSNGSARASWFSSQIQLFINNGAYAVMLYDYNTSSHNTSTDYNQIYAGTLEYTVWKNAVDGSP